MWSNVLKFTLIICIIIDRSQKAENRTGNCERVSCSRNWAFPRQPDAQNHHHLRQLPEKVAGGKSKLCQMSRPSCVFDLMSREHVEGV